VTVLVVDDVAVFREAASEIVHKTPGFELIAVASSGAEAIRMADQLAPDLVLMDVRMEGIDGSEAARIITATRPETVVVLMSAAWTRSTPPPTVDSAIRIAKEELTSATLAALWRSRT